VQSLTSVAIILKFCVAFFSTCRQLPELYVDGNIFASFEIHTLFYLSTSCSRASKNVVNVTNRIPMSENN
jgi:hypothetical protein